jgi:formylglycine-generating enzyme required for sulfatase activity
MKRASNWTLIVVLAALLLAACVPAATATPTTASTLPPATEPPTAVIPPTSAPTLVPVSLAGPQTGTTMKWMDTSVLAFIPAGEFQMGNGVGTTPQHTVYLDAFWIQQTKVTNGMYKQCVAAGACTPPTQELGAPQYTNTEYNSHPVVGVSWDQANGYCQWIGGRLPTEAEWEKSARGTQAGIFPWGNDGAACDFLNFANCIKHTSDVTDYAEGRSPYGLYDMAGNVFEWVGDFYGESYYNESPAQNPTGPEAGEYRVIRGSSFETEIDQADSALRHFMGAGNTRRDVGFRCAVPQPKPLAPICQVTPYIPGVSSLPQGECALPVVDLRGQYCSKGDGFVTMNISEGAVYELNRDDYSCIETVVDGKRLLTCMGPRSYENTVEVTVCNASCTTSSPTASSAVCDPGYVLDAATGMCVYSPIASQVGVAGCPVGYVMIDRGGAKSCALAAGSDGLCSAGLYYDTLYGACISPTGMAEIPYGISNPEVAQSTYAGCAPGYSYDSSFQCCQAASATAYPACPAGTTYSVEQKACLSSQVRLSGPGCVTVEATTLKCSEPVDICSKIVFEPVCRRNSYACVWDDKNDVCKMKE